MLFRKSSNKRLQGKKSIALLHVLVIKLSSFESAYISVLPDNISH